MYVYVPQGIEQSSMGKGKEMNPNYRENHCMGGTEVVVLCYARNLLILAKTA